MTLKRIHAEITLLWQQGDMSEQSPSHRIARGRGSRLPRSLRLWVTPTWLLGILVLALAPARALAQENGDRFTCHTDRNLKKARGGRIVLGRRPKCTT